MKPFCHLLVCLGCCLAPLTPCRADTPADELLRLVPEDVGFCFVLRDLRGHAAGLLQSPFLEQFRQSPLSAPLRNDPEVAKLTGVDKYLKQFLGLDSTQIRDDILGDALVLAYRPGPPGRPEEEQGLVLVRARDA